MTAVQAAPLMTVGELSRRTGVPVKALREYTDWGLIFNLGRSGANYRLYDDEALGCVQAITELRGLGLTLAEIRWLASSYPDENGQLIGLRLAERLRAARARVEVQIAELELTRHRIDAFETAHRHALAGQPGAEIWGGAADRCASSARRSPESRGGSAAARRSFGSGSALAMGGAGVRLPGPGQVCTSAPARVASTARFGTSRIRVVWPVHERLDLHPGVSPYGRDGPT